MVQEYCIIGGFPRAGTRQYTDILNRHPGAQIKGEVFSNKSFKMVGDLLLQADLDHSNRWSSEKYQSARYKTAWNLVAGVSKGSNEPFSFESTVIGFKCPRIEIAKATLDIILKGDQRRVQFYFCARQIIENYLSLNSTFGLTAEKFVAHTNRSLKFFSDLKEDSRYNCEVLVLDEFIGLELSDKGTWINENLFKPLSSFETTDQECAEFYAATRNINATEAVGKKRIRTLSDEDAAFFERRTKFWSNISAFEQANNIDISSGYVSKYGKPAGL